MNTKKDRIGALVVAVIFAIYGIVAHLGKSRVLAGCFFYFAFLLVYILFVNPWLIKWVPQKVLRKLIWVVLIPLMVVLGLVKRIVDPLLQKFSIRNLDILARAIFAMTIQGVALILITYAGAKYITEDTSKWLIDRGFTSNAVIILLIIGVIFFIGRVLLFITTKIFEVLENANILPKIDVLDHFHYDSVFYKTIWKAIMLFLMILFYALVVFLSDWFGIDSSLVGDAVNVVTFVTLIMLIVDCYGKWWDELKKVCDQLDDSANGAA